MSTEDDTKGEPRELAELRAQVDAADEEILEALRRRRELIDEVAAYKRAHGREVRDLEREAEILRTRRETAERLGLLPDVVESIFRMVLWASRDQQGVQRARLPPEMDPKTVAIVGGRGELGARLAQLFDELGHTILIADHLTELTPEQAAAQADVTVISVPIAITEQVIRQVGPHVREDALLMDVTSLKGAPVQAMLEATRASVVGTHPMFGPGVHSLQGQRVVLCEGRGEAWTQWLRDVLKARGLVITECTPQEHDRAMAAVQVLTHYQTQVLGLTLARIGVPLEESLRFTSPAYLMELYVAARHFGQEPALYGPIEMDNPEQAHITRTFSEAAQAVKKLLDEHDQAGFEAMFQEVRAFFGEFSELATEESRFLIDRLVERS